MLAPLLALAIQTTPDLAKGSRPLFGVQGF
jgi:hypothetical protein